MLIMLSGLVLTLAPKIPGTLVILLGAALYVGGSPSALPKSTILIVLVLLAAIAELGGRLLRVYLTQRYSVSRVFSVNSTVGNIAGILTADTLFGSVLGMLLWEMLAGRTLRPHWDSIGRVIWRLTAVALLRGLCGVMMIISVLLYTLQ